MWDDVPANPNDTEEEAEPPADLPNLPDFHLEEDFQTAEEALNGEEFNLHQQSPPPPPPQDEPHLRNATEEAPITEDVNDGGRYIEKFPEEYLAGATWGRSRTLFESLDEEQKQEGGSRWAPFEDEDEWQLAEWLIRNVGQKQTDSFLRLPIVCLFSLISLSLIFLS
jgi:hypothetical protein